MEPMDEIYTCTEQYYPSLISQWLTERQTDQAGEKRLISWAKANSQWLMGIARDNKKEISAGPPIGVLVCFIDMENYDDLECFPMLASDERLDPLNYDARPRITRFGIKITYGVPLDAYIMFLGDAIGDEVEDRQMENTVENVYRVFSRREQAEAFYQFIHAKPEEQKAVLWTYHTVQGLNLHRTTSLKLMKRSDNIIVYSREG